MSTVHHCLCLAPILLLAGANASTCCAQADKSPSVATNDDLKLSQLQQRVRSVAEKVRPVVVAVEQASRNSQPADQHHKPLASGVMISPDGLVLSQYHVTHMVDSLIYEKSFEPGKRVKVILADGKEVEAELLGADRTSDLSLLQIVKPGNYPCATIDSSTTANVGEWIVQVGHPMGYRVGRPPVIRLGRVLCRDEDSFATDCRVTGGDSGGPLFDLNGQLVGIIRNSSGTDRLDASEATGRGFELNACSTMSLIHSLMPEMKAKQVRVLDGELFARIVQSLQRAKSLEAAQWTQGSEVRNRYREVVNKSRQSVTVILSGESEVVALGTIVDSGGLILTKASSLPADPKCLLPSGKIEVAEVLGVDPAFDLALLRVNASDLNAIEWSEQLSPAAGTLIAVPGAGELPQAIGVVSVPRRDMQGPFPTKMSPTPRVRAALPELIGSAVQGRGYWVEYVEGAAAEAGIVPGYVILQIGKCPMRSHQDLAECVRGRWAGEELPLRLFRSGRVVELTLQLQPFGQPSSRIRDNYPTVFEHDAPVMPRECGGPIVGLDGKAIGVTIARIGTQGCMAIPADHVRELLRDLQSGALAKNWIKPVPRAQAADNSDIAARNAGKAVTISAEELKNQLAKRRDRFKSLFVEYDVVTEAHVKPRLLASWKLHSVRDYQESLVVAFAGEKRFTQVNHPEIQILYAPMDRVTADPSAPNALAQSIEQERLFADKMKANGKLDHLFMSTRAEETKYLFDGEKCFIQDEFTSGRMEESPIAKYYSPDIYLSGLGLRPLDPNPRPEQKRFQLEYSFPENFAQYKSSHTMPLEDDVDGCATIVIEATRDKIENGSTLKLLDRIWFDAEVGYAPRKWERWQDGNLSWQRTNTRFREFASGCWLPLESTWTHYAPPWVAEEFRSMPAYTFNMQLRMARVNDVSESVFRPAGK